ncbi:tRNA lysidine(34) synthetase TilS [Paenibacillus sp. JCM 10914]|uniref:tRNA lysidine(34) synthetase TilS n=1 Tax=Paenibacillus sp. JCM 10914 TaxID=1236974 RepID=UPI0003CC7F6C|nr:tRNA lysidine(34) synthetase TilS [Paenibacillus sp. JCM 10914]GAE09864.1 tRNA delta(2)-isopentenylpyrophosphate transferase [Paenibacillus sp. JCM 10914]
MKEADLRFFVEEVKHAAAESHLWEAGDAIVVAVSGGPDSIALLHVLHEISVNHTPLRLICAHAHHGFRQESDAEVELVRLLAESLSLPLEIAYLDMPAYMAESGKRGQEASRLKRYAFLFDTARQYGARSIALAHHADDQAETVMMRLLRGSGLSGLAGMRMKRSEQGIDLIRPFLRMNKSDILELCHQRGYTYAIDSSNLQTKYHRNAIRLEVFPYLEQYNGQFSSSLNQLAEIVAYEDDFVEREAAKHFREMVQENDGRLAFDAPSFLSLHVALQRRLIKLILNYLPSDQKDADFVKIESVRQGILSNRSNWRLDLGHGITCVREYGDIVFWPKLPSEQGQYIYILESPDVTHRHLPAVDKILNLSLLTDSEYRRGPRPTQGVAFFDADELRFPLTVRNRQPGDKMKIMGLNGSKKVKDILIDEKIPPSIRSRIPMVCDATGNIVWIPGVRRSVHAACGRDTSRILRLEFSDA